MTKKPEPEMTVDVPVSYDVTSNELPPVDPHEQLMNDPKYAVHVHESQLKRIVEVLEDVAARLVTLEEKVNTLEVITRFSQIPKDGGFDGPPEPPVV
tara:strand:- start:462 stop:752 length:291 start_codon:yes stop_codon:yes gene_type:complete